MKAVILLSGGLDSTTCAALAVYEYGFEDVLGLTLHYGQKHAVELDAAAEVAAYLGIEHVMRQLPPVFGGGGSALMGEAAMPELTYEELGESFGVSPTYVPFRNGNLLSAATALAMSRFVGETPGEGDAVAEVWAGMHGEDAHNWAYPDCTPEFLGAMANAIYIGTYRKVRLVTPLMWDTKAEVVTKGLAVGAPFALTHSCYQGARPACGTCPTCVGRIEAFRLNGLEDPIPYAVAR
jgi:7-cyano-7-deazaguanine synthase